jgi:hypothetical protein
MILLGFNQLGLYRVDLLACKVFGVQSAYEKLRSSVLSLKQQTFFLGKTKGLLTVWPSEMVAVD